MILRIHSAALFAMGLLAGAFVSAPPALAQGDVTKGEKVFKRCKACHAIGEGAKAKVGPPLTGIVGRAPASFEGYKYSKVLVALGGAEVVWNAETLDGYLKKPKNWLKDTAAARGLDCAALRKCRGKMAFPGLKKDEQRADLIAYLDTFSPAQ